ncbi:MAG: hypothetical protein ABDH49_03610, partial [Candidatus Hydrothermales bacterium]
MIFLILFISIENFKVIYPTYLGNPHRNFYGINPPDSLSLKWKIYLGFAKSGARGQIVWGGTSWSTQALITEEKGDTFLYIPSLSHYLFKVRFKTGELVYKTKFNDALKMTPSFFVDDKRIFLLVGTRKGLYKSVGDNDVKTLHLVSPDNGEIIFSKKVPKTLSFSKDTDASPIVLKGKIYWACENGYLYKSIIRENEIVNLDSVKLFDDSEAKKKRGNVTIEASPTLFNDLIFVSSSSGRFFGVDTANLDVKFDINLGGDLNGTPHLLSDEKLLVTKESESKEDGGVFLIDPFKTENPIVWFFPIKRSILRKFGKGVIGSAISNEFYVGDSLPRLVAFNGTDGYFYVLSLDSMPEVVFKEFIGGSISTPLIFKDRIITCSANGSILLYEIKFERSWEGKLKNKRGDKFNAKIKVIS